MQKVALPGWCQILDELTSECAKVRDLDVSEARIGVRKKMAREKRGRGCCAAKLASTPTTAVSTIPKGGTHDE